MGHLKRRVLWTRVVLLATSVCTIASFAMPPAARAATTPSKPLDPVGVAVTDAVKAVQDLLSQAQPAQAALQTSAAAFQAKVQQIIADGQQDPTTIQPAIEALVANPTGIISTTALTSLALSLAAKAAQPICPVVGAVAAETAGVAVPTMPDYSIFGPLADVVKQYDQTGMNTIRDFYVQVFAKLLAPITGLPAQAQSVVALANVLLNLIAINWHTTNYPAGGGAPIVHDTPGFLFLPTLVDTDNNLAFDLCVNNGFDLLGKLGVALQIDRVPLADANQRTDVQTDFLLKVLHAGYTTPLGAHIPSMFETTHTLAGQPFATKVQWPGDSLSQFMNLAGAINYKVNTVGTPINYTLSSAKPATAPSGTVLTKWTQGSVAKGFSYEMQIPGTLLQGVGASNPAPGSFEYCTSKSPFCSNETGDTVSTQSMHFKSSNATTANQYGVLGAGANGAAPTTCPAFALLGDAHVHGTRLYLGYKTGANGKVWIDTDNTATDGCLATAGLNNSTLPVGFSAQDRLVTFGPTGTTPVALTKSGTISCPAGTNVTTLTFGLSRYFCLFAPVNTALPTITGQVYQASELTASPGTWTPPAPNAPTFTYQWLRCDSTGNACVNIAGATSNKYTNTPDDLGHAMRVAVTATNLDGAATAVSNATGGVTLPPAPVNTVLPSITGTIGTGLVATADKGTWINAPTAFAYQWQLCDNNAGTVGTCTDIPGATGTTYTPSASDQGHFIQVVVTGSNIGGQTSATSAARYVPPPPTNSVLPFIKNGAAVATGANVFEGDRLKAINGSWTDVATFAYQWQKCDAAGDNCADIPGATHDTYAVGHDDIGGTLRVKVTGTNPDGSLDALSLVTGLAQSNPYLPKAPNKVVDGSILTGADSGHESAFVGGLFDTVGDSVGGGGALAAVPTAASKAVTLAAHVKGGKVNAVASDTAGGYFLGGTFTSVLGSPCLAVAHVKVDGTLDPVYCQNAAGFVGEVRALDYVKRNVTIGSSVPVDVLAVGGLFTRTDGHSNFEFIDNTGLASFSTTDPDGAVNAIADDTSASRPNFFPGGEFTNIGKRVALVTITAPPTAGTAITSATSAYPGGVDCSGGTCTNAVVRTVAFGNPSSLPVVIVGGTFDRAFGTGTNTTPVARRNVAAFTENSGGNQIVGAWDPNPNGDIYSVIASSTTVLLAGDFTSLTNGATTTTGYKGLAEYGIKTTLTSFSPLNWVAGPQTSGTAANSSPNTAWKPQVDNGRVLSMIIDTAGVYVGGSFTSIGGTSRHRLAQVSLPSATAPSLGAWDPNAGQTVRSIVKFTPSSGTPSIFAGGDFLVLGGDTRNNLAELKSDGTFSPWAPVGTNGAVKTILAQGGVAYVGGAFTSVGGITRNHVAAFASDGSLTSWDPNVDGVVNVLAAKLGGGLYIGGAFGSVGGASRANLAEIDSAGVATAWNPGTSGAVNAILVGPASVYVGGVFANAGGAARSNLAEIDGTGVATGWDPSPDGAVNALALAADGVYVGGAFASIGGAARSHLALVASDGTASAWNPGADGNVNALRTIGAKVLVGGSFANLGGAPRNNAGLVNDDGTAAEFAPDPNGAVAAIPYTPGNLIGLFGAFTSLQGGATPTVGYGFFGGA
ncbi:MAG: trimeric autotransporter adhesin [Actinomycetota bacterium]|jgi:hypothetical protein